MKRISIKQSVLLLIALLGGLGCAYIDAQPIWDDTGILVFAILFLSGLVCLLGFQRPWRAAICVGVWIPLYAIIFTHNYGSLLALGIAFIGAYAGWGLHTLIRKTNP
jgi:hypothetical protein